MTHVLPTNSEASRRHHSGYDAYYSTFIRFSLLLWFSLAFFQYIERRQSLTHKVFVMSRNHSNYDGP